jgi:hypothetical protein
VQAGVFESVGRIEGYYGRCLLDVTTGTIRRSGARAGKCRPALAKGHVLKHDNPPVRVAIEYRLAEYISILDEFASRAAAAESGRSQLSAFWNSAPVRKLVLRLLATPIFYIKRLAVGTSVFEFDAVGLRRLSKGRLSERRWEQVKALHVLSQAYLIELDEGLLPLPFRAFSEAQRRAFADAVPPETPRIER